MLEMSEQIAKAGAEILGGIVGGALGGGGGMLLYTFTHTKESSISVPPFFTPFIGVAGIALGVLIVRIVEGQLMPAHKARRQALNRDEDLV